MSEASKRCGLVRTTVWAVLLVPAALSGCIAPPKPAPGLSDGWTTTALFFGQTEPVAGSTPKAIAEDQWRDFLARSVTSRFPDGFTILLAEGQYRGREDGLVHTEPSRVLLIMHPLASRMSDDAKLKEIAREYVTRFHQEAVMRSDWISRVGFVGNEMASQEKTRLRNSNDALLGRLRTIRIPE